MKEVLNPVFFVGVGDEKRWGVVAGAVAHHVPPWISLGFSDGSFFGRCINTGNHIDGATYNSVKGTPLVRVVSVVSGEVLRDSIPNTEEEIVACILNWLAEGV